MAALASTLPANVARTNFYQMLDEVEKHLRRFVITHRGKTRAVVLPGDDVDSWEETLDILSNDSLMKQIRQSEKDFKSGRFYTLERVERELLAKQKRLKSKRTS